MLGGDLMDYRVYLVEDDAKLNQIITYYLQKEGWHVQSFANAEEAVLRIEDHPHLWILDIVLPGMNGYELIKKIKLEWSLAPVIFISSKDTGLEKIIGLELGSDDYLSKPFMVEELILRARVILKRIYTYAKNTNPNVSADILVLLPYTINREKRLVTDNSQMIDLSNMEYNLLLLFIAYSNQYLNKGQILEHVWGGNNLGTYHLVDDLVHRLRKKMPLLPLKTKYGYGYKLMMDKHLKNHLS